MIHPPSTSRVNATVTAQYRPRPRPEYLVLPSSARKLRKLVLKNVCKLVNLLLTMANCVPLSDLPQRRYQEETIE
jgi:hypothetical protein